MSTLKYALVFTFLFSVMACGSAFESSDADQTSVESLAGTTSSAGGNADELKSGRFFPGPSDTVRTGERFPSVGELRISLIFARFDGDDSELPEWSEWPDPDNPEDIPEWMDLFLSSGPDDRSADNYFENVTNYFKQSSFGNLRIFGDTYYVAVPDSFRGGRYGDANRYVIQSLFGDGDTRESRVSRNLNELDNWHSPRNDEHVQESNGYVDYVVVIYRRPRSMAHPFNAAWNGIAGLGSGEFNVDYGLKIRLNGNNVSGATVTFQSRASAFGYFVHEVGHHLVGSPHPYKGSSGSHPAYWGIFDSFLSNQSINAYERDLLGWHELEQLSDTEEIQTRRMGDYYTTGDALSFTFNNGTSFIFENRQKLVETRGAGTTYDQATINETDKGLFVYSVNPPYSLREHNLRTFPADGHHIWDVQRLSDICGSRYAQPVFNKTGPNPWGMSYRDTFVLDLDALEMQGVNPFSIFINDDIQADRCHTYTRGLYFDTAFGPVSNSGKRLFSSFTNPASLDESGEYSGISFYVHEASGSDGGLTVSFSRDPYFRNLGRSLQIKQDMFFREDAIIPEGAELHLAEGITMYMMPETELQIDGTLLLPDGRLLTGRFTFEELARLDGLRVRELTPHNPLIDRELMN